MIRAALPPIGLAKPDWRVAIEVANAVSVGRATGDRVLTTPFPRNTSQQSDKRSNYPEYKLTAVRIEAVK